MHASVSCALAISMTELSIFVLAGFLGYQIVTKVPPLVHTPLLSATNAICGISIVGALVEAGAHQTTVSTILGVLAVTSAMINIVGGFLMTDRMLKMFRPKPKPTAGRPARSGGAAPSRQRSARGRRLTDGTTGFHRAAYLAAAILFILGMRSLTRAESARRGMQQAMVGMLLAIIGTLVNHSIVDYRWIIVGARRSAPCSAIRWAPWCR